MNCLIFLLLNHKAVSGGGSLICSASNSRVGDTASGSSVRCTFGDGEEGEKSSQFAYKKQGESVVPSVRRHLIERAYHVLYRKYKEPGISR